MSLKTPSRYARSRSETPMRRPKGSPPGSVSSYSSTLNGFGVQKLNIVNRVAIEGSAKKEKDSVKIRMYLKVSLPVDSAEPGTSIPLFPEDNIKVVTSQVHPLDNNSVPYHFDSQVAPLLHRAAKALSLSSRPNSTFNEAFNLSPSVTSSSMLHSRASSKSNASSASDDSGLVDEKYTGHIVVSGYNVAFVVPKHIPAEFAELPSRASTPSTRRMSVERAHIHFMAAIEMIIPYVSRPPRAPYLLSIPTPTKCLNNSIKLKIFPPRDGSSSTASLSDDDAGTWDFTSDPHVSRASRASRNHQSLNNFADDESSDSSSPTGLSGGFGLNGSFPSTDRIRIRWAKPKPTINADGRGRVGVREVKGDMTCVVKGKMKDPEPARNGAEGIILDVDYKGTCKGVWYDGVATLLGMEVGLLAKGSEASWCPGSPAGWEVTGGNGFTGFDSGVATPRSMGERQDSLDSFNSASFPSRDMSRTSSVSSSSSLLRAPLPAHNTPEYSFEGSASSVSTLPSVGTSTSNLSQAAVLAVPPPSQPITIHVNINELLPPTHNVFTFSISGTILIVPKPTRGQPNGGPAPQGTQEEDVSDPKPVVLPEFTVFVVDNSTTATTVRNEVAKADASVEVYNSIGDYRHDPQARKTVLQKGGYTKCGTEGGRIAYRTLPPVNRARTPNNVGTGAPNAMPSTAALMKALSNVKAPVRSGPVIIPYVNAVVTALVTRGSVLPNAYAVRITMPTTDSEWLEFGLGYPDKDDRHPKVDIASVSVDGVPVHYETVAAAKPGSGGEEEVVEGGVRFEQMSGKEWISWVRVQAGNAGNVLVDYVVQLPDDIKGKRSRRGVRFDVFLPTFSLPVGKLEVVVEDTSAFILKTEATNLSFSGAGGHLLQFSIPEFFYPLVQLSAMKPSQGLDTSFRRCLFAAAAIALILPLLLCQLSASSSNPFTRTYWPIEIWRPHEVEVTASITSTPELISTPSLPNIPIPEPVIPDMPDEPEETKPVLEWAPSSAMQVHDPHPLQRLMALTWKDIEPVAARSYEKFTEAATLVWSILRWAYHYPTGPA